MPRYVRPALALSAGLALALSGCSGLTRAAPATEATYGPITADTGAAPPITADPRPADTRPADTPAAAIAAPTPTPPAAALAGTDFTRTGSGLDRRVVHLRFDVLSLTRQGQLLELAVRIASEDPIPATGSDDTNNPDDLDDLSWNLDGLSDTRREALTSTSGFAEGYSGTTLVDGAAKKRYLVAVDSNGNCLCTAELNHYYEVGPGQSLTLNATYAAPPATTTKLDVDVPGIGDFADVPIS